VVIGAGCIAASSDAIWGFSRQHWDGGVLLRAAVSALVLGADVSLLTNPVLVRMAAVLIAAVAAFVIVLLVSRSLRRHLLEGEDMHEGLGAENTLYPYSAIIQQLKQQKFELQHEQQTERRKARTSEQISSAVIAHLPCGVLFIAPNGLVRQANAAAKQMLGFASPLGMSASDIFREAAAFVDPGTRVLVADIVKEALHGNVRGPFEAAYVTSNGHERSLSFTLITLGAPSGEALGVACAITDESSEADWRQAQLLRSEVAVEMALHLRTSVATIRECAKQMNTAGDRESAAQLALDISAEAERLEREVGGFLIGRTAARSATAAG
jgi:PAS domain-containing protein